MNDFSLSELTKKFPTEEECLEEIKRLKFPEGIICIKCKKKTKHYKIENRKAYACKKCRTQIYPLAGTIFEKSTTPLRIWFYAMFLMTHSWGKISVTNLQTELGVTYKTAWRISKSLKFLMSQHNGDLLREPKQVFNLNIFNAIEFNVVQKENN